MDVLEYKEVFISEAKENIQTLNNLLVHIEKKPDDINAVEEAFRLMHSIKGSASMVGLTEISEIAHEAESILSDIRDGKRKVTSEVMDLLFSYIDKISMLLEKVTSETESEAPNDESDLKNVKLKIVLDTTDALKPLRAFMLLLSLIHI